jgi:hypothetical protein
MPNPRLSQHQAQMSPARTSSPLSHDPQLYQPDWAYPNLSAAQTTIQSTYVMQAPAIESISNMPFGEWDVTTSSYDLSMAGLPLYQQQMGQEFLPKVHQDINLGMTSLDPMIDLEFSQFVQVS